MRERSVDGEGGSKYTLLGPGRPEVSTGPHYVSYIFVFLRLLLFLLSALQLISFGLLNDPFPLFPTSSFFPVTNFHNP